MLAQETVKHHWGEAAPAWVLTLAKFCDDESQAAAARKIGRSGALINQVLRNKYPGRLDRVGQDVARVLSDTPVACPVLGEISGAACLSHQRAPYNGTNHMTVKLYVACRKCPNNLKNQEEQS